LPGDRVAFISSETQPVGHDCVAAKPQRLSFWRCAPVRCLSSLYRGLAFCIDNDGEVRKRAMPMLFWLPMIFMSVLLEMNGFPPEGQDIGETLSA
jgi:hypothetical protein